jgi:enediyne core biosynthesis thioesterase
MPAYEHRHIVGFQETSLVGNVYFSNYVLWQGHCREHFLHEFAPEVVGLLSRREVAFFTANCSCEYIGEWGFSALDEVLVRMRLSKFRGGRMSLGFEYVDVHHPTKLVARGTQDVNCKAQTTNGWVPAPFPAPLIVALQKFAEGDELQGALQDALDFQRK